MDLVDNEFCIIVQFINEYEQPVQIGYQCWLDESNRKE